MMQRLRTSRTLWCRLGLLAGVALTGTPALPWAQDVLSGTVSGTMAASPTVVHQASAPVGGVLGMSRISPAMPATPSEAQAEAAYDSARKTYGNGGAVSDGVADAGLTSGTDPEVVVMGDPYKTVIGGGNKPSGVPLDQIRLVIDVDNTTLRDVFSKIISQAATYTGPWTVKWRLKPENMSLLDERVNLTAESKFGDFVSLLTDRVRNMSGVQLYVTTFQESRVILVTDTYY